jgi:hypothetical protein
MVIAMYSHYGQWIGVIYGKRRCQFKSYTNLKQQMGGIRGKCTSNTNTVKSQLIYCPKTSSKVLSEISEIEQNK